MNIKKHKHSIISALLFCLTISSLLVSYSVFQTKLNTKNIGFSKVEKLNQKTCLIHCNNNIFSNSKLLLKKEPNSNGFNYSFFDNDSGRELYSLNSRQDINLDDSVTDEKVGSCALAWAVADSIFHGVNLANRLAEVFGGVAAGPLMTALGPLLANIAACVAGENIFVAIPIIISALSTGQILTLIGGAAALG